MSQRTLGALAEGDNGFANLGTVLGATLGSKMVDTIVDGLVSPQGLFQAAEKNGVILQNAELRKALTYAFFISPTQFRAELENRQSEPPQHASIVMIFSGFEWKVSRITIPTAAIETASKNLASRSDRLMASPNNSTGSKSALSQEELKILTGSFQKCWKSPNQAGLIVTVRVHLKLDGYLSGDPIITNLNPSPAFRAAAESALRAVRDCQPYRMPATSYESWKDVEITFDPREARR